MKIKFIAFLILSGMAGVCLAQNIGTGLPANGSPSSSGSSSPMGQNTPSVGNTTTMGNTTANNINSENAQDNSETGAQGNTENSTY